MLNLSKIFENSPKNITYFKQKENPFVKEDIYTFSSFPPQTDKLTCDLKHLNIIIKKGGNSEELLGHKWLTTEPWPSSIISVRKWKQTKWTK